MSNRCCDYMKTLVDTYLASQVDMLLPRLDSELRSKVEEKLSNDDFQKKLKIPEELNKLMLCDILDIESGKDYQEQIKKLNEFLQLLINLDESINLEDFESND